MRIAQVVNPWVSVPPIGYGGVERIVSFLTEELVRRGHEVSLFATGDSKTTAQLRFVFKQALGNDGNKKNSPFTVLFQCEEIVKHQQEFDIIHFHDVYQSLFFSGLLDTPTVHTIHGTTKEEEQPKERRNVYLAHPNENYVTISHDQQKGIPSLSHMRTVYNGVDIQEFPFEKQGGEYFAWIGRITAKKGIVEAIESAKQAHVQLKIAAIIDPIDQPYFEQYVKPIIDGKQIQFFGELSMDKRIQFIQQAKAVLFPVRWSEPFGLVLVEAMASGTPVIAFNNGSVPEIVIHEVTGYTVAGKRLPILTDLTEWSVDRDGVTNLTEAIHRLLALDPESYCAMRQASHDHAQKNFTIQKMVDGYEDVYEKILLRYN